ncbi:molybdenum cofactor guanylyltransferase MobA [Derxia gummosa]|uniref:Molybdenum cofactor guanylyltransferase n=1 Tax=Derxia gummosa DSM 723 TaxID=1121388 RepID=A0A9U5FUN5_9BURK|nr:molybdenum cofactor guanylyltransferase MobA [Derxia gummosa]
MPPRTMTPAVRATPARADITGLILAGGRGSRMGDADKGLIELAGRPLVTLVLERLLPQVDTVMISANRNLDRHAASGWPVLRDLRDGYPGPLAGLEAGLRAATTPWLVMLPCDAPFFPLDLVARLAARAAETGARVVMAECGGHREPAFMLVARELADSVGAALDADQRKLGAWAATQGAARAVFDDESAFRNLNTPDDLAAAG